MIFQQFFYYKSCNYTYLLAKANDSEAIIIDPVDDDIAQYLDFMHDHNLHLVAAVDTHMHADHISGLMGLRAKTGCITIAHLLNKAKKLARRVDDGDLISINGVRLEVIYTPGHTNDSCCFYEKSKNLLFTGDTLLIRGCGSTDFELGDPDALYDSITKRIFLLPDSVNIYPGHDYKGENMSTIGLERLYNEQIVGVTKSEFIHSMTVPNLKRTHLMDTAIEINSEVGASINTEIGLQHQVEANEIDRFIEQYQPIIIDVRSNDEIRCIGTIEGSFNFPYERIDNVLESGGILEAFIRSGKTILFVCAYGDRSSLVLQKLDEGLNASCYHLKDGIDALRAVGYPLVFQCNDFE